METPISQIALSVNDRERSRSWYQQIGLEQTGGMGPVSGAHPAQMLGLTDLEAHIAWVAGHDPMSQLELIEFSRPVPRPLPEDWGLQYAGYGFIGLVVPDFEKVLRQFRSAGTEHTITGIRNSRSIWTSDPDDVPLEILEKDPLGLRRPARNDGELASIRTISLTVGDLAKAKRFWISAIGLTEYHHTEYFFNDVPGNLATGVADWEEEILKGGTVLVRLLKPRNSTIVPWTPDHRLSDTGLLNIAVIMDDPESYKALCERFRKLGYAFTTETPMLIADHAATIYGHDDQGNSIEIGYVLPGHETSYGWKR